MFAHPAHNNDFMLECDWLLICTSVKIHQNTRSG